MHCMYLYLLVVVNSSAANTDDVTFSSGKFNRNPFAMACLTLRHGFVLKKKNNHHHPSKRLVRSAFSSCDAHARSSIFLIQRIKKRNEYVGETRDANNKMHFSSFLCVLGVVKWPAYVCVNYTLVHYPIINLF